MVDDFISLKIKSQESRNKNNAMFSDSNTQASKG